MVETGRAKGKIVLDGFPLGTAFILEAEDLDFMLLKPDSKFDWEPYLKVLTATFEEYGLNPEAASKAQMDRRIRNAVIKNNSVAN